MPNLPTVGGDANAWGGELNTWLLYGHNPNGAHGQLFSPLTFGGVGDGVTSDNTAIASAIGSIPVAGGILDLSGAPVSYAISQPIVLNSGVSVIGTFINNQDNPTGANKTDIICLSSFAGAAVMGDAGALATGFTATVSSATISAVAGSALFTATGSTFTSNAAVRVGGTTMPGNFVQDQTYFVIPVGTGTFGLSATSGPGTPVAFSTAGTAVTVISSFGASLPVSVRGVSIDMTNVPTGQAPDGLLLATFRSIIADNFIRGSAHSGTAIHLTDQNLGKAVISGSANENRVMNNWIVKMAGSGIVVDRTTSTAKLTDGYVIANVVEMQCINQGDSYDSTGIAIDVESAADWQVNNNHVYRCPNDGIVINHSFTSFVLGNKVDNFGLVGAAATTYHGLWVNNANGPATMVANNEVDADETHGTATTNYHYFEMAAANTFAGAVTMSGNTVRKDFQNPNAGGSVALSASGTGTGGSLALIDQGMMSVATSGTAPSMAVGVSGTVNLLRGPLPAIVSFTPSQPAGNASTTLAMAGIGSVVTFTPVLTGKVRIRITAVVGTGVVSTVSANFRAYYGTGTAPSGPAGTVANLNPLVVSSGTGAAALFTGANAYVAGQAVVLGATTVPTNFTVGTTYFVTNAPAAPTATAFYLSATSGTSGTAVAFSTAGAGVTTGTAVTGTQFWPPSGSAAVRAATNALTGTTPFAAEGLITGLTLGTTYWADLANSVSAAGGIAEENNIVVIIEEVN